MASLFWQPRDDTGRPFSAAASWKDTGPTSPGSARRKRLNRLLKHIFVFAVSVLSLALYGWIFIHYFGLWPGVLAAVILWCLPINALHFLARHKRLPEQPARLLPWAASLLAHGRCGACNTNLRDLTPDDRGMVTCPTCATTWHHHRFTLAPDVPPKAAFGDDLDIFLIDDRGVALQSPWTWPPIWSGREKLSTGVPAFLQEARAVWRRRALIGVPLVVVGSTAAITLLYWFGAGEGNEPNYPIVDLVPVLGVAALVTVLLFLALGPGPRWQRAKALALGFCRNCGQDLRSTPAQFDGCHACPHCGRAWSLGASHGGTVPPKPAEGVSPDARLSGGPAAADAVAGA